MQLKALKVFLRMLELRKLRSGLMAKRARNELLRAEDFAQRLLDYQREYQQSWIDAAAEGGTVEDLMSKANFVSRLRVTLEAQGPEVAVARTRAQTAAVQAAEHALRAENLKKYLQFKKLEKEKVVEKKAEREVNDQSASRRG